MCVLLKIETDKGRFATKDNEMIFQSPVYLVKPDDVKLYYIIDEEGNIIDTPKEEDIIYISI